MTIVTCALLLSGGWTQSQPVGTAYLLSGSAELVRDGKVSLLRPVSRLKAGDQIRTGGKAKVRILFAGTGRRVELHPLSTVRFKSDAWETLRGPTPTLKSSAPKPRQQSRAVKSRKTGVRIRSGALILFEAGAVSVSFPELGWQYGETPDLFRLVFRDAMGKVIDEAEVPGNARSHRVSARVLKTERFTLQVATLEDGSVGSNVLSTEIEVVDDRDLKSDLSALDQITELDRLEKRLLRAELFEDAGFLFQWRLELTAAMALADPETRTAISKELERQPDSSDEP